MYYYCCCPLLLLLLILLFISLLNLYKNNKLSNIIIFLNPIMMISFCRKITPHSILCLTTTTTTTATTTTSIDGHEKLPLKCHRYISPLSSTRSGGGGLLGLVAATENDHKKSQPFVLESSSIKSSSSSPSNSSTPALSPVVFEFGKKKDPRGFGFIDDIGGGVDGLTSCTESLGFESSNERLVDDHQIIERISHVHEKADENDQDGVEEDACLRMMRHSMKRAPKWTKMGKRRVEPKKYPPPLSSLNQNGHPRYYLRPERKDGRLELTEVRIYRPEIFRAYREDGRLRLHLVSHEPHIQEEEEPILEAIEEVQGEEEAFLDDEEEIIEEEKEEDSVGGEWLKGGAEGFRRCQNLVNHHHHHRNLPVWSQQQHCVTTR
ncbi:protein FANTASTIC FOUR 3-like [Pyrus communis]|uniref:protein FANTASTIC FOUR 3-like n=1 Tax=Pyrus communis TaxID=23211 RepID=UPI0035C0C599